KQPEHIVSGITLNAYIAVLAAVSKAALILPVSEAIGQLKWIWFQQDAALWDFQLYDSASRGPWGSFMLLLRTRCKHLVSLGALITVLALAFEPFFQQIVAYPERITAVGQGLTWSAMTFVPERPPSRRQSGPKRDPSMSLAIDGAFDSPEVAISPSTSTCSTGNCTWPTYSTLGVCHECQDVSFRLRYLCKNNTIVRRPQSGVGAAEPCGFVLDDILMTGLSGFAGSREVTSLSTVNVETFDDMGNFGPFLNTTVYHNATLPIVDFYIGYTPGGPSAALRNDTPVLLECLLTWCAKTLKSQFNGGILQESVIETITIQPEKRDTNGDLPVVATLGQNDTFSIVNGVTRLLSISILTDLPLYLPQDLEFDFVPTQGIWKFHETPPFDFETHLSNVTKAMTNNMKSRSSGVRRVEGTAWNLERFVEIRWAWIALPAASLLGSVTLICATIWKGRKHKASVWKSSALATLLHGLSEETRDRIDSNLSSSQIEAISTKVRVKLSSRGGKAYLVAL
ncbi:hypothetical protein BKA66DRAFT_293491, partial [Pyrenochaeta sp. MPI-SDFR-AT-0127]